MRISFLVLTVILATSCERKGRIDNNSALPAGTNCDVLQGLNFDGAKVTGAELNTTGRFAIPNPGILDPPQLDGLPPFCRVTGTATPAPGSSIEFEAWLPVSPWNGRVLMLGNGGYSSSLPYAGFPQFLKRGYVTVATDTGHTGDDPDFARDRPEAIVDWGHRAVHTSITHALAAVNAFYGKAAEYTYFAGCSTGGHQALMTAQRYPEDFDGILAGAPGHNRTHLNAGFLWQFVKNHDVEDAAREIIPAEKLPAISAAVLAACRENNGARSGGLPTDPYLDDPLACDFDPQSLLCSAGHDNSDCLTSRQSKTLQALYDGPRNPRTGERIYFGQTPGSESAGGPPNLPGWSLYWADPRWPAQPARANFWRIWVFDDDDWDWWRFDFDQDMAVADRRVGRVVNAMDPDLSEFQRSGGKLIHYHGLNDPVVPMADSISYFSRVDALSGETKDFYRLFLAPGMEHCGGGPGPWDFDALGALEAWVERGEAPDRIVATRYRDGTQSGDIDYTRPLCPYPTYAIYDGKGDRRAATSFECRTSMPRSPVPTIGDDYMR